MRLLKTFVISLDDFICLFFCHFTLLADFHSGMFDFVTCVNFCFTGLILDIDYFRFIGFAKKLRGIDFDRAIFLISPSAGGWLWKFSVP